MAGGQVKSLEYGRLAGPHCFVAQGWKWFRVLHVVTDAQVISNEAVMVTDGGRPPEIVVAPR